MLVALIAPELLVAWALRQSLAARDIEKDCRNHRWPVNSQITDKLDLVMFGHLDVDTENGCGGDMANVELLRNVQQEPGQGNGISEGHFESPLQVEAWTRTHAFFGWMGGFLLYINHTPRGPLTPHELFHCVRRGYIDMPTITQQEIEDKSKSDCLSKGFFVLQLAWFVIQLGVRIVYQLPTTQLEINTLSVTTLSLVAYCCWWKKPKDVRQPYHVHWKMACQGPKTLTHDMENSARETVYHNSGMHQLVNLVPILREKHKASFLAWARRVSSRGCYPLDVDVRTNTMVGVTVSLCGMVFGALHWLAWNSAFPTQVQQTLWHAASLVITFVPVAFTVFCSIEAFRHRFSHEKFHSFRPGLKIRLVSSPLLATYVVARLVVLVLMFLSLRSPPDGIYDAICWTSLVPHV